MGVVITCLALGFVAHMSCFQPHLHLLRYLWHNAHWGTRLCVLIKIGPFIFFLMLLNSAWMRTTTLSSPHPPHRYVYVHACIHSVYTHYNHVRWWVLIIRTLQGVIQFADQGFPKRASGAGRFCHHAHYIKCMFAIVYAVNHEVQTIAPTLPLWVHVLCKHHLDNDQISAFSIVSRDTV